MPTPAPAPAAPDPARADAVATLVKAGLPRLEAMDRFEAMRRRHGEHAMRAWLDAFEAPAPRRGGDATGGGATGQHRGSTSP